MRLMIVYPVSLIFEKGDEDLVPVLRLCSAKGQGGCQGPGLGKNIFALLL